MLLLSTLTYELHNAEDEEVTKNPQYAILSHRWSEPKTEITFRTLNPADLRGFTLQTPSAKKIRGACAKARERKPPLAWLWIDTCCIDKSSTVEETRSINSMFEWYRKATVCYTYLNDVVCPPRGDQTFKRQQQQGSQPRGQESVWFERGWTLQELLTPQSMEFYDVEWKFMGTRADLADDLQRVTGIDKRYLTGHSSFREASVATKMSWMAGRVTKEVEDIAYSMLGLFNVNLTPLYGEGCKAFMRLQRAILESSTDESIFAWTVPEQRLTCYRKGGQAPNTWNWPPSPCRWGLLAPSPDCFRGSGDVVIILDKIVASLAGGYKWTHQGLQFEKPSHATNHAFLGIPIPQK